MFWKRGNKWGAMASIAWGMIAYALGITVLPQVGILGTHPSLVSVVSSMLVYVIVSLATPPPPGEVVRTFWGAVPKAPGLATASTTQGARE